MRARLGRVAAMFVAALAAACASPPTNFYALRGAGTPAAAQDAGTPAGPTAMPTAGPTVGPKPTVAVGPVSIPAQVDRPQIVLGTGTNQLRVDEFNRWAAPLSDNIAGVLVENLAQRLGGAEVWIAGQGARTPQVRIGVIVQRFEIGPGEAVVFEALWTVRPKTGPVRSGHTAVREPTGGSGIDAAVAAHSRALARASDDIAAAIRSP